MNEQEITIYLNAALDQEACKATLTAALVSRVESLFQQGIPQSQICESLEILCEDEFQLNDDVIFEVIEWIYSGQLT